MTKKPASLYPYREAQLTPTMIIVGGAMTIIMVIVLFVIMQVPSLA